MRSSVPTLHCDADDGMCTEWAPDEYAMDVSTIGGVPVTTTERAPGWVSVPATGEDFCPDHKEKR